MLDAHVSVLLILVPLFVALLASVASKGRWGWWLLLAANAVLVLLSARLLTTTVSGGVSHYAMGGWAPPWGIEYRIDALNALVAFLVCVIGFVVSIYGRHSLNKEIKKSQQGLFIATFLLCETGLLGIALTGDIFNLFVFLEISSLATYALISMGRDKRSLTAAFQYLIMGTLGATFFLIGIGLLYAATGTLNMTDLSAKLIDSAQTKSIYTGFGFILVGMMLKTALYPLHLWLPNAYQFAPSLVSTFLAATATKVSLYVIIRCIYGIFGVDYGLLGSASTLLLVLASVAIIYGSVRALQQHEFKRLLAYSSIAQMGYLVMGLSLLSGLGLSATMIHLFNHGIIKAALFMIAGCLIYTLGHANIKKFQQVQLGKWLMIPLVISGLSLIGVPGTLGFVSKWYLLQAALDQEVWLAIVVMVLGTLLSIAYVGKMLEPLYFTKAQKHSVSKQVPPLMHCAIWLLALACVYLGIDTELTAGAAATATNLLMGNSP